MISVLEGTSDNPRGLSVILPTKFAGLAALISSFLLAGVGPQNIQNAFPGGQNAKSPELNKSLAPSSS